MGLARALPCPALPLANFLANGLFELRDKLGPILWQFPPMLPFKPDRFEAFFAMLPHDTEAAARIAERHDERVAGRMSLDIDRKRPMRHGGRDATSTATSTTT